MGIRDRLIGFGRVAATALGDTLLDLGTGEDLNKASPGNFNSDEGPDTTPGGSREDTSTNAPAPTQPAQGDPKALFWDPFAIIEQLGYKERASPITYGTLKAMVWKMPIIQAIIQTRQNQVASFCRPQRDRYQLGFKIQLRDSQQEPTKQDKKFIDQMTSMVMRTGLTTNPRGRDSFEKFVRKLVWDSYVYDQMCFEIVPNRLGQPAEWYAVDASTMRIADSASTYVDEDDFTATRYVQVYDGIVIAEYTQEELCFGVRNPRTDIRSFGYGVSELEMLVNTITALLWAWEYNQKFFSQGVAAKGILNFKGAIPEDKMKAFRRHWYQMLSGVGNAWRTPITNADEVEWHSLQNNNKDMEYNAWMDFLIKVACSMYQMDPVEVNFKYGNTGQKGAMAEDSNKDKITESKERGLRPMLRFLSQQINRSLIWPINESFEFEFVGLDARTHEEMAELNTKRVKSIMMIDEIRAEDDLPPIPDGKGQVILDPTWVQFANAKDMAAQEMMPGMEGGPDGGPDGGGSGQGDQNGGQGDMDFASLFDDDEDEETEKSLRRDRRIVFDVNL